MEEINIEEKVAQEILTEIKKSKRIRLLLMFLLWTASFAVGYYSPEILNWLHKLINY